MIDLTCLFFRAVFLMLQVVSPNYWLWILDSSRPTFKQDKSWLLGLGEWGAIFPPFQMKSDGHVLRYVLDFRSIEALPVYPSQMLWERFSSLTVTASLFVAWRGSASMFYQLKQTCRIQETRDLQNSFHRSTKPWCLRPWATSLSFFEFNSLEDDLRSR